MTAPIRWSYAYAVVPPDAPDGIAWPLLHGAVLTWDPDRPWEVGTRLGRVEWLFGWELLTAGLDAPAGDGDVHITPLGCLPGGHRHQINLHTPYGQAGIQLRSGALRSFAGAVRLAWADRPLDDEAIAAFYAGQEAS